MVRRHIQLGFLLLTGCSADEIDPSAAFKNYPADIGEIFLGQCAIPACHSAQSKEAAAGLSLASWDDLFKGSRNNAAIVPFRPDQSFLLFFINSYADLGPSLSPRMPYLQPALERKDVILVRDWISDGAPNAMGDVKFSSNPLRKKVYVACQGCDIVNVLDAGTMLIMRAVDVGSASLVESPHMVRVSPDRKWWYVCFYAGSVFQKYDAATDKLAGEAVIGSGSWNTFTVTADGRNAWVVDWNANGSVACVDLESMSLVVRYQGGGLLDWPHGCRLADGDSTLYVTAQYGNFIYRIDVSDPLNPPPFGKVVVEPGEIPSSAPGYDPHEIAFSPDGAQYFVSCQGSDEVRVFDASTDTLIAKIPTGAYPVEMAFSKSKPYLFVTCMEDDLTFPGRRGSVSVINYENLLFMKSIFTGFQPHGIEVDDEAGIVYVTNRNVTSEGPAPHHSSACGGRNGYLTLIDLETLNLVPGYKSEMSVDPYSVSVR